MLRVLDTVRCVLWSNAARHHLGEGLDNDPSDECSFKLAKQLQGDPEQRGVLECILCSGVWTPARVHAAFPYVDDLCPFCKASGCDEWHLFWTCHH